MLRIFGEMNKISSKNNIKNSTGYFSEGDPIIELLDGFDKNKLKHVHKCPWGKGKRMGF